MVTALPHTTPARTPGSARLAWLDALRGVAALAVVAEHMLPWVMPALRPYWFNLGMYGVLVFFAVSGYIIPASLEHRGDVRAFWIGRMFRLYPLYLLVIGLTLLLGLWIPVRPHVPRDMSAVSAHLTMLLDVVHVAGVADTMWTLSYEMVFYLLVAALFVVKVHRRSGVFAVLFGLAAIGAGLLIGAPLVEGPGPAYVSGAVFVVGMICVVTGRFRRTAACVLGLMAVLLLFLGSYVPWLGAAILAAMFTGTVIHRWERGAGPLWPAFVAGALIALSPVWARQAGWWWVQPQPWITTIVLAAATFALGMALRRRRVPAFLAWLGLISYSVYLLHHPMLRVIVKITGDLRQSSWWVQLTAAVLIVAVILAASWATYRLVEVPMQRMGRRVAKRFAQAA
ncbi:acyltransferase family protein [Streptosporangium sp. KLBMP 9127]|nr:acyltransferase [Streptosporangium sp. KLBMP 9127]